MRFAPTEDEVMVEDMLDRLMTDMIGAAPRRDGEPPAPEPAELRARLGDLGLWGGWLPEAAGGGGGGARMLMILARGLGRRPAGCDAIGSCVLPGALLARAASGRGPGKAAAAALCARLATGEATAAAALFEPRRRWALDPRLAARAESGDGGATLTGEKAHVAAPVGAEAFVVSAAESGGGGAGGVSVWLVPADTPGLRARTYPTYDGAEMASLTLDAVRLPEAARLHGPGEGAAAVEEAVRIARFAMAAEVLGACESGLARTVDYLKDRKQFGRPLASFQALQFRAADLHAEIELLRSVVLGAAETLAGPPTARARGDVAAAAAMAAEIGDLAGREAIHLHGAIGMTRELGVGRHLMRVNALTAWLGDADHLRDLSLSMDEEEAAA
ncbi:MAG: acyl-CoA dehydrogenase [Pseudomonadota bacterium]|nr:acyl-CoA dehydrogenase [Pseudomonadota bacterium]